MRSRNYGDDIDNLRKMWYAYFEVIPMPKFEIAKVRKLNILNELRKNNMTLQEQRFFLIYLSQIDTRDISTRVVRFPLINFIKIMGIVTDVNMGHFKATVRRILQQVVEVPNESGSGYTAFQLFKRAKVEKDEQDEWYVEFDAHDDALPLMFEYKNKFFKYGLWNVLRLKSLNQIRMYEILKQYEKIGKRELTITDLRELIGVKPHEYSGRTGWSDFKKYVLDSCQKALKETTDICYSYERGKVGKGGKWITIVFHISKNNDYIDQLTLDEFIEMQPEVDDIAVDQSVSNNVIVEIEGIMISELAGAVNNEFKEVDMREIYNTLDDNHISDNEKRQYLARIYQKFEGIVARKDEIGEPVYNRFALFKTILDNELNLPVKSLKKKKEHAYDGEEIQRQLLAQFMDEDEI